MRLIRLFKKDLAREMAGWVEQGLLQAEQARAICAGYGMDYDAAQARTGGYNLLLGLGYLFIGLALITLIGANWDDISRGARMGGLIALTMATQLFAMRQYLSGRQASATGLFGLGNLFYGASIILIAQIYHLGEHMPDGIFWWALGSLPVALILANAWLMVLCMALALTWFCVELEAGFYPAAFPLFIAAAVYVLVRARSNIVLFLQTVVAVGLWLEGLLAWLWGSGAGPRFEPEHAFVTLAFFILAHGFGHWLGAHPDPRARDYAAALAVWTVRLALLVMLVLSFKYPWRGLITEHFDHLPAGSLAIGSLIGGGLFLSWRAGRGKLLAAVALVCVAVMAGVVVMDERSDYLLFQVATNIALVLAGIVLILRGVEHGQSHYFFVGIATILLTGLLRYIDLVGDYVGGAALFGVMALALIGAARLWKHWGAREVDA